MKLLISAAVITAALSTSALAESTQAPTPKAEASQPDTWEPGHQLNFSDIPKQWLQGEGLKEFEKDTVYIIDFWKAPRKAPRSYRFGRRAPGFYGKEILDVFDRLGKRPENVELLTITVNEQSSPERIREFLAKPIFKSEHNIALEGPSGPIHSTWMPAVGFQSFPHSIIVKNGELIWSGEGSALSGALVLKATQPDFDLQAHLKQRKKSKELFGTMRETTEKFWAAYDKGTPTAEIHAMIDEAEKEMGSDPFLFMQLQEARYGICLERKDKEGAIAAMKRTAAAFPDSSFVQGRVHKYLSGVEELKPESLPIIIGCMERQALLKDTQYASYCWLVIGDAYKELGETEKATEAFKKAVSMSNSQRRLDTILAGGTPAIAE